MCGDRLVGWRYMKALNITHTKITCMTTCCGRFSCYSCHWNNYWTMAFALKVAMYRCFRKVFTYKDVFSFSGKSSNTTMSQLNKMFILSFKILHKIKRFGRIISFSLFQSFRINLRISIWSTKKDKQINVIRGENQSNS